MTPQLTATVMCATLGSVNLEVRVAWLADGPERSNEPLTDPVSTVDHDSAWPSLWLCGRACGHHGPITYETIHTTRSTIPNSRITPCPTSGVPHGA